MHSTTLESFIRPR